MPAELKTDDRCHYTYADGRRCRMLRTSHDPSLCLQHLRQQLQPQPDPGAVAAELLGLIEDFSTATAINKALGRLFAMVAGDRIPPRNAALLVYICQLLLNTLPAMENEITTAKGYPGWEHVLRRALHNLRSAKSPGLGDAALQRVIEAHSDAEPTAS